MKIGVILGIFLFSRLVYSQNDNTSEHGPSRVLKKPPAYFNLEWKKKSKLKIKPTSIQINSDSLDSHLIYVLLNKKQDPVLYYSNILTPVCADGDCKLMQIKLYWTLLGDYAGFDVYDKEPLTKHDHDTFLHEDYLKLHALLLDSKSILKKRKIDELVEKPSGLELPGIDAVSGATVAEVKETVVSGALYSCYVAWHLVHGNVNQELKKNTIVHLNENVLMDMLYSDNKNYQLFALNKIDNQQINLYYDRIVELFKTSIPLVRISIINNCFAIISKNKNLQIPFWENFSEIDINSQTHLLEYLNSTNIDTFDLLSNDLAIMTKNQLKYFLRQVERQKSMSTKLNQNLQKFSKLKQEPYSYVVEEFLEELRPITY